ncbi:STAS-like domain-containing protein [Paraburkholderia phymatum]|uniref:STAS-like domain-containing protein n=1 Tax=Paraburkholderia phymatum TaxID=148447 RepID=A0ACC6UD16_9BURK
MKSISVARQFSEVPVGRFYSDGPDSGERFRDTLLEPALKEHDVVQIDLDGTDGYGSSFLEEAFGGIVRKLHLSEQEAKRRIQFHSTDPSYVIEINDYMRDAAKRTAEQH